MRKAPISLIGKAGFCISFSEVKVSEPVLKIVNSVRGQGIKPIQKRSIHASIRAF
jgi:hypothetical protein